MRQPLPTHAPWPDPPSEDELFNAVEEQVFKCDGRSRVWLVRVAGRGWVVKRYEYSRARQMLAMWIGIHPAQVERRRARQLAGDGLPVVPVAGLGVRLGQAWLVTPQTGQSLQRAIAAGLLHDRHRADRVIRQVQEVYCRLVDAGWYFRDLQVANLTLDVQERVWLIDTGGSRRSGSRRHAVRMLAMLGRSARVEGASRVDTLRGLKGIVQHLPGLGPLRPLARQVIRDPSAHDSRGRGL